MSERERAGFNPDEFKIIADAFNDAKAAIERKRGYLIGSTEADLAHYIMEVARRGSLDRQAIVARAVRHFTVLN